jgi:hypothetical protein
METLLPYYNASEESAKVELAMKELRDVLAAINHAALSPTTPPDALTLRSRLAFHLKRARTLFEVKMRPSVGMIEAVVKEMYELVSSLPLRHFLLDPSLVSKTAAFLALLLKKLKKNPETTLKGRLDGTTLVAAVRRGFVAASNPPLIPYAPIFI